MSIYQLIPRDRYITREELVHMTGFSDRKVREVINELRKRPETVIVSNSRSKGYKRPSSIEELKACLYESKSRVKDEEEKQRVLEKAINAMESQLRTKQLYFDF